METKNDIDRQVAEKVMGWKDLWSAPNGDLLTTHSSAWSPSTNIAHAFEVRDKIKKELFSVRQRFRKTLQMIISERLELEFGLLIHQGEVIFEVIPTDICLAALEAVK